MKFNFRAPCEVRPLSPSVEGLLRSLPEVHPPEGVKLRLLAAYERRQPHEVSPGVYGLLRRNKLGLASGSLAAVAVFGLGLALRSGPSDVAPAWETVHPMPSASLPKFKIVDDPRLTLGAASSLLATLDPQDGP